MCKSIIPACEAKMDEDGGKDHFKSKRFGNSWMSTNGFLFDPWHSTPVKKHTDEGSIARQTAKSISSNSANQQSLLSAIQGSQTQVNNLDITTIHKQRMELQLLIAELKDREQELNSMASAHHRQLQAWEQDRQRVLTLEQRSARLEDELQKRNEVIRAISKRLKTAEVREQDSRRELSSMQQQMQELSQRQQHSSQQHQDLEERNQCLNSSILTLSSQLGQLQVHEEELSSMLKLKDKDMTEATNHILGLAERLRESESSLKECQVRERKTLQETEEYRRRLREARHQNAQLKDELQEKTLENNSQREELIRLRQENQLLRKELSLADESECWKEELLALARSKQERTESELLCLRQVCEHQQNDLQLLKLNLETTREALMKYESQRSLVSPGDVTCVYTDCSTPTPRRSTTSPGLVEDAVLSKQHQEAFTSSTCRLKRLLAESQQMVASLELCSGKPLNRSQSPPTQPSVLSSTSRCDSVCSLNDSHTNTETLEQIPSPNKNQEEIQTRRDDSLLHSIASSQKTKEYDQEICD
ncbi:coiled-coil domain-containing protein 62 [Tachysurus vachellii]|uniref:coiled-coil domain-containing protein 62 n=1 Tax=Tachysurus vachellii TaxID=175792 RepID=UPI00296B0D9F|nr:coiled-coil domain-containing protein 62 [Tachysurus vachellii]